MNLFHRFQSTATEFAFKDAIFWGDDVLRYEEILQQSREMHHLLTTRFQLSPKERVGIWLRNSPSFVAVLFGIWAADASVVPINNFLKPDEVAFMLKDAGVRLLISEAAQSEHLKALTELVPGLKIVTLEELKPEGKHDVQIESAATRSDLAVIIYTSGTTGKPKGAMLTHGNLLHNVESCRLMLEALEKDRFVVLLPMFHSFMLTVGICLPMIIGSSIVVVRSIHPAKNILQEILSRRATILPAIPQFFRTMAHATLPPNLPLRLCISGAAPLPGEILREFTERCKIPLLEGYGLSEASPVVSMNPIQGPWKAGSIGVPIPNVEVTVQDEAGNILKPREIGEICVRGGNVMLGYWNQPEETAKTIRNGWLRTGDVGYGDEEGYFFITDRIKDMLLVNGINVYPREIEELIYKVPGVKEAAVIGVPDQRKGEHPVGFVALDDGAAFDCPAVLRLLREKLATYKVPKKIHILPALPRNATGKILKTALRQMVADGKADVADSE